jgi:OmpA-OmpF porin, OOP family
LRIRATRRPTSRALPTILALLGAGGAAGCAGSQLVVEAQQARQLTKEARENGAYRCAPRELALAEANAEFAELELGEGDYFRARQHVKVADENARAALKLSARDRCVGPFDRDKDGVLDAADRCPKEPEDKDGFEDADGCPDPDNDKDEIADAKDKCPTEPEDKDGFEDADGCPDPDNDRDGVADGQDRCPVEAGPLDNGGCPKKYEHIVVTQEKIELRQKIFFESNKAVILPRSYSLLAEIASVLQARKTMQVRIEGHTDSRGGRTLNMRLSQARADSVRQHLVGLGIGPERMEARGYGPEQPIETNRTASGRERNRRVEFVITQQ